MSKHLTSSLITFTENIGLFLAVGLAGLVLFAEWDNRGGGELAFIAFAITIIVAVPFFIVSFILKVIEVHVIRLDQIPAVVDRWQQEEATRSNLLPSKNLVLVIATLALGYMWVFERNEHILLWTAGVIVWYFLIGLGAHIADMRARLVSLYL